jgi:hypothetical protein
VIISDGFTPRVGGHDATVHNVEAWLAEDALIRIDGAVRHALANRDAADEVIGQLARVERAERYRSCHLTSFLPGFGPVIRTMSITIG